VANPGFSIQQLEKVFTENPKLGHEQLREWKAADHAEFLRQAIDVLEIGLGNSFSQVVLQMCREDSSNLKQMLFTADLLSLDDAARLLRITSKNDPGYQVHLVSSVKAEFDQTGSGIESNEFTRLLEILSKSVDPERMGGMLSKLADHPDLRLRSKAAILAGSLSRQSLSRASLLKDADLRVRANAVEGLWGQLDHEAVQLLKEARLNPHHRVSANALYGLYLAGDLSSIRGILKLARESDVARQLAGIWLIGQTADPRFHLVLHENLSVRTGRVKFALLGAMRKIKKRQDELRAMPPLALRLVTYQRLQRGRVYLDFGLMQNDGSAYSPQRLLPTQILVQDGNLRIDGFHFEPRGNAQIAHLSFLIPHRTGIGNNLATQLVTAMESALKMKRDQDAWAIRKYRIQESTDLIEAVDLHFSTDANELGSNQLRSIHGVAETWLQGVEQALDAFPDGVETKQIVLVLDTELPASEGGPQLPVPETWPERFKAQGLVLHVVCCRELETETQDLWRTFCHTTGGVFLDASAADSLPQALQTIASLSSAHFHLTYQLSRSLPNSDLLERVLLECWTNDGTARLVIQKDGQVLDESMAPDSGVPQVDG